MTNTQPGTPSALDADRTLGRADALKDVWAGGWPSALPVSNAPEAARSPLAGLAPENGQDLGEPGAPRLAEAPPRGMITVKCDLASLDLEAALQTVLGVGAPEPRRARLRGERGVLWMAPDEVLVMTGYAEAGAHAAVIDEALAGQPRLVAEVSDARAILRLSGAGARETIAKGAPVDLHPESFRLGDVRRTRLSTVAAAIVQTAAAPETFEILCFRSYAPAVWAWARASARAKGLPGVFPIR